MMLGIEHRDVKRRATQSIPFATWLGRWIRGGLRQPTAAQDEVTDKWRGATDEELEQMPTESWRSRGPREP